MRAELIQLINDYPSNPPWRDPGFKGAPVGQLLKRGIPAAMKLAVPEAASHKIKGSHGQGGWTLTPWLVLLDPAVTLQVEEGYYVVYLLSAGGDRLYLTLNQGCTTLMKAVGRAEARHALRERAATMWERAKPYAKRLSPLVMDLGVPPTIWRGKLYEAGAVAGRVYDTNALPDEATLVADLREALDLYRRVKMEGGWAPADVIQFEAENDQISPLHQAKTYRYHRSIERQSGHSAKVKKAKGTTRCEGCDKTMAEMYGAVGEGVIDAHHLTPLHTLADGQTARFDPIEDFALLCPNCHRIIHRFDDPSDVGKLRSLVI